MKRNYFKSFFAVALGCAALVLTLAPAVSRAESFNVTNQCVNTDDLRSWPTNGIWTNGLGYLTGRAIDVRNIDTADFYVSYLCPTNSTNGGWKFVLVRSWSDSYPECLVYTNGPGRKTFEDPENSPMVIYSPSNNFFATGHQTNLAVTWQTNLPPEWLRGCNWVGIYSMTNGCPLMWYTNLDAGLTKKIKPVRFP